MLFFVSGNRYVVGSSQLRSFAEFDAAVTRPAALVTQLPGSCQGGGGGGGCGGGDTHKRPVVLTVCPLRASLCVRLL